MSKMRKMAMGLAMLLSLAALAPAGELPAKGPTADEVKAYRSFMALTALRHAANEGNRKDSGLPDQVWRPGAMMFDQIQPALERYTQQTPPERRSFVWTDVADVKLPQDPVFDAHLRWLHPDQSDETRQAALGDAAKLRRATFLLLVRTGALVEFELLPQNVERLGSLTPELAPLKSVEFQRLALAHAAALLGIEGKHGMNQRLVKAESRDEFEVLFALGHGAALWQTEAVARLLGAADLFPLLMDCQLRILEAQADDNSARAVFQYQAHLAKIGFQFLKQLEQAQGSVNLEQIFDAMPTRVALLEKPADYLKAHASSRPDVAGLMERVKQSLPAGGRTMDQALSGDMIRQVAALFKAEERAAPLVAGCREARAFVWLPGNDPSRQLAVSVIRFDTPARAASYFGFAVDLQRQRDELMASACASTVKVQGSTSQPVRWPGVDEGLRCDKQLEMIAARQTLSSCVVLIRQGNTVVEFNGHGTPVDEDWAKQACQVLLDTGKSPANSYRISGN